MKYIYLAYILFGIFINNLTQAQITGIYKGFDGQVVSDQNQLKEVNNEDWPVNWEQPINTGNFGYCKIENSSNPRINNIALENGDFIGVFWADANGNHHCAGAGAWNDEGLLFVIFADDPFTPVKDGLVYNEELKFKFYDRSANKTYPVPTLNVTYGSCSGCIVTGRWNGFGIYRVTNIYLALDFDVVAFANPDTICNSNEVQLSANVWVGSGPVEFSWTSNPPGFESNLQNPVFFISETTEFQVFATNGQNTSTHFVNILVNQIPLVDAGVNGTVCLGDAFEINGDFASHCGTIQWTTSGDGIFSEPNSLHPLYTPGSADSANSSVVLYLTGYPLPGCQESVTDSVIFQIMQPPSVNAGSDFTVCSGNPVQLNATALHYGNILWVRTGTGTSGTFNNPNILNPLYTLSSYDQAAGIVNFTITVQPINPCTAPATDQLSVLIKRPPAANAGAGGTICATSGFNVNGTASQYSSVIWTTNGDGYFSSPGSLSTQYIPGNNDRLGGIRFLKLTAYPNAPCLSVAQSTLSLVIIPDPYVNAGDDAEFYDAGPIGLSGTASNYSALHWYSSGTGYFSNPGQKITQYFLSSEDFDTDTIFITFEAIPNNPCVIPAKDTLLLLNKAVEHISQLIQIPAGWSGISSYVKPDEPTIEGLLAPLSGKLIVIQDNNGIYWPSQGINTLLSWSELKGYQIKLSAPGEIEISGTRLMNRLLAIDPGWSFLPVLSECPVDITNFPGMYPEIYFIKDIAGNGVYWPSQNINNLGYLLPGKSYMIYTFSGLVLTYPECSK